tara:strand:- start:768 stop:1280 length:513 start_codon:yes stop_codon:yes gene_type:complete
MAEFFPSDPYTGRPPSDNRSHGDRAMENIWQQGAIYNLQSWAEQASAMLTRLRDESSGWATKGELATATEPQLINLGGTETPIGGIGDYISRVAADTEMRLRLEQLQGLRAVEVGLQGQQGGGAGPAWGPGRQVEGVQTGGKIGPASRPAYRLGSGSFNRENMKVNNLNI